jgi:hypothetical protein
VYRLPTTHLHSFNFEITSCDPMANHNILESNVPSFSILEVRGRNEPIDTQTQNHKVGKEQHAEPLSQNFE